MNRLNSKLLVFVFLILLIISVGCGSQSKDFSQQNAAPREEAATGNYQDDYESGYDGSEEMPKVDLASMEQKIIKNGEINITVQNNIEAETKVSELVTEYRGLVQNTSTYTNRDNRNTEMVLRIPAESFDKFINELKNLGEVTYNHVYTTDVTEEYIDLSARQKNLVLQEERLQEMLQKANKIEELLQVESELARVRGEIESITGRLKYLDNRISFSTIRINLRTKHIPTQGETKNFGAEILFSFQDGLGSFTNFIVGLIKTMVWLLPFLIIGVPIVILLWRRFRSSHKKK